MSSLAEGILNSDGVLPENCLVSLADFLGFVCEVSTRQKLSTFSILSLLLLFAATQLLSYYLILNKNVYGLLTGDAFDWTTNEPFPS